MLEKKYEYNYQYQKENIKRVVVKFNKTRDEDILAWIASRGNVQGAIKRLIRNDIYRIKSEDEQLWNEIYEKYIKANPQ